MERLRAACVALTLVTGLAGCSGNAPDPLATPGVLAGTWVADGPASVEATLEFEPDGSMEAESLPAQVALGPAGDHWFEPIEWSDLESLHGRWRVQENGSGNPYVGISLSAPIDGRPGFKLDVRRDGDEWIVYYAIGGEDTGQTLDFHRSAG